jgi:NAD(P)-dependent dehydrogenase (short-subunit alcohol dehydrogenase family)
MRTTLMKLIPWVVVLRDLSLMNTIAGLILIHTVQGMSFTTLFCRNYYTGIPPDLLKAARIDGAQQARVAFLDIDADAGAALVREVASECGAAPLFVPCDLLDIAALRIAIAEVRAALGDAAVLVNNAANDQRQVLSDVTPAEFDWMIDVNLRYVFFAAQAVVPQMQARGGGSIINMSSIAWIRGAPALPAYAAAKAAIVGFTNSLARLVGPDRIRVNAIAPGMVITERQRRLWFLDEQKIAEFRARQAIPDAVTPDDVARLALFLASDESQRITRQCFLIDGGLA